MRKLILRLLGYKVVQPQPEVKLDRKHEAYKSELRRAHLLARLEEKHGYVAAITEYLDHEYPNIFEERTL